MSQTRSKRTIVNYRANIHKIASKRGDQWIKDYIGNCYHQTCDVWDPNWDLHGAAQDIELFQMILQDLGNSTRWPQWQDGSEFKAIREQSQVTRTDSGSLP